MTKDEALARLRALQTDDNGNMPTRHMEADQILCEFLVALGHADVAQAWEDVEPKWYE